MSTMEQKAQDQIEAGLSEYEKMCNEIDTLKSELQKKDEEIAILKTDIELLTKVDKITVHRIKEPMPQCFKCGYIKKEDDDFNSLESREIKELKEELKRERECVDEFEKMNYLGEQYYIIKKARETQKLRKVKL